MSYFLYKLDGSYVLFSTNLDKDKACEEMYEAAVKVYGPRHKEDMRLAI